MLESLLDQSFYEFPSFKVAIFSLLLAFALSTIIAFTYRLTYRGISYSGNFFQAMILASIATSTIIMAVGNNLAVGFGIIGAIAIIRFRTRVNDPKNIIFILASMGVGIATGVYGYAIAVAGTLIFSGVAIMLYFSPHGKSFLYLYTLTFNITNEETIGPVLDFLNSNCESHHLMSIGEGKLENAERYEYQVSLLKHVDHKEFYRNFIRIDGVSNARLNRRNNIERL